MPTSAEQFESDMIDIWGSDPRGQYDTWHNANEYAKSLGASRTGRVESDSPDPFEEWEFGDGSKTWIGRSGRKTVSAP